MKRKTSTSRGQSLVEFALIVLPLVIILVGLLDVGRAIFAYNTVANAAREAARVAIVNQNADDVEAAAVANGSAIGLTTGDVVFTSCGTQYCQISVTVNWDFNPVTPLIGDAFNPVISSTASMPIERVYVAP